MKQTLPPRAASSCHLPLYCWCWRMLCRLRGLRIALGDSEDRSFVTGVREEPALAAWIVGSKH